MVLLSPILRLVTGIGIWKPTKLHMSAMRDVDLLSTQLTLMGRIFASTETEHIGHQNAAERFRYCMFPKGIFGFL